MLVNRFETSPNYLLPQKRFFHMTDESNFTVVGYRPTLENWELLKLNYAFSTCKCNMPCRLFSVVHQCKPLPFSAVGMQYCTGSYLSVIPVGKQLRKATGGKILLCGIYTEPGIFTLTRKKFAFELYKLS